MTKPIETTHDPNGGVVGLARRAAPHLDVVSASEAVIRSRNVIGFLSSAEAARSIVLDLESMSDDGGGIGQSDSRVGLVVMGSGQIQPNGVDPEGVARWLGPRVLGGLGIGAIVGALLGGGLAALFDAPVAGGALGGAFLLAIFMAIWLTFAKLGGSEAYRQTFVDPHARELAVVSWHTDDASGADEAFERLSQRPDVTVVLFDESLSTVLRR